MLWASDNAPRRPGYRYYKALGGGMVGYSCEARPYINVKHIDGPLLYCRDGQLHFLSLWERLLLRFGRIDALSLEAKLRPELQDDGTS